MRPAVLENVTKRFGDDTAVDNVSFYVDVAEVVALLGRNGAGKTTSISLLLGLRTPDAGTARIFGGNPRQADVRRTVGVTPQEMAFPLTLRVAEIVDLVRKHYPAPEPSEALLDRFALSDLGSRQIGGLSGGQRRRLAVALAFAGGPPLLVLDEPTSGLDVDARYRVWHEVRDQAGRGGSVLLTTHHLDEAEALASRVVVIERGRIVADGSVTAIKAAAGLTRVRFRLPCREFSWPGAECEGDHVRLLVQDAGESIGRLVRAGVPLDELEVRPVTLEEALAVIGHR